MGKYLTILEKNKIIPNFWCSEEYFQNARWEEREDDLGIIRIQDSDGVNMLPPFPDLSIPYWASFPLSLRYQNLKFLDFNFIYNPSNFLDLRGSHWTTFRKNIKKFPKGKNNLYYEKIECVQWRALDALTSWLMSRREDEEIYDDKVILKYITESENKKILYDDNNIYGVNIWDENYMFINYRYCWCANIPFLSEYLRFLFYTDPEILSKNKKVNDGGCLNRESLYNFKMRLNPETVYRIYTTLE